MLRRAKRQLPTATPPPKCAAAKTGNYRAYYERRAADEAARLGALKGRLRASYLTEELGRARQRTQPTDARPPPAKRARAAGGAGGATLGGRLAPPPALPMAHHQQQQKIMGRSSEYSVGRGLWWAGRGGRWEQGLVGLVF